MRSQTFLASCAGTQQAPAVAAQDLTSVFKAGYLEKRRKGLYVKQRKSELLIHHMKTMTVIYSSRVPVKIAMLRFWIFLHRS